MTGIGGRVTSAFEGQGSASGQELRRSLPSPLPASVSRVDLEGLPLIKLRKEGARWRPPKRRQDRCPHWATTDELRIREKTQ